MNSEMSAIREQLLAEYSPIESSSGPIPTNGASSPQLPALGDEGPWQSPHQSEVAEALRQRSSAQVNPTPMTPEEMASQSASAPAQAQSPPDIQRYLQRLHLEAEKINNLYQQQELAIRNFQKSANGLSLILMKQPNGSMMRIEQICDIQDAALTQVVQDENRRYVLMAVDLDLTFEERAASETAAALRSRSRTASPGSPFPLVAKASEALSVANLGSFWHQLSAQFDSSSRITPTDILLWCGGGVIGRLALDLALAAFPGLWPWMIGIIIGAVALGLYRLLFAKKTDVAFIVRLFLALVGLIVGGQL